MIPLSIPNVITISLSLLIFYALLAGAAKLYGGLRRRPIQGMANA